MLELIQKKLALRKCRNGELPESVCCYLHRFDDPFRGKTPIEEVRFVVFDTETTGFDVKSDRIISIGAVGMEGTVIDVAGSFEVLLQQEVSSEREAVTVHGLLRRDIDTGMEESEAVCRFLDYLGNAVIVAHHADFDIGMINQVLARRFGTRLFNEALDTASFAKRLEKGPYYNLAHKGGEYRLDNLCDRYGIRLYDRHTAPGDAYLTAQLFQHLLALGRKAGIDTLGKLLLK
ncbi:MAG TPA: 3'-5' exonuclease [Chlorobaculum parvum]|uniref:3'-5' exonuclease n=1 Tax=Chlorobaculum parvum TaxID=274539 RepID=A0A7C5DEE2_9CHLB|nr:3'-5' exonuclease [Chlorobaculum parvum]